MKRQTGIENKWFCRMELLRSYQRNRQLIVYSVQILIRLLEFLDKIWILKKLSCFQSKNWFRGSQELKSNTNGSGSSF